MVAGQWLHTNIRYICTGSTWKQLNICEHIMLESSSRPLLYSATEQTGVGVTELNRIIANHYTR